MSHLLVSLKKKNGTNTCIVLTSFFLKKFCGESNNLESLLLVSVQFLYVSNKFQDTFSSFPDSFFFVVPSKIYVRMLHFCCTFGDNFLLMADRPQPIILSTQIITEICTHPQATACYSHAT